MYGRICQTHNIKAKGWQRYWYVEGIKPFASDIADILCQQIHLSLTNPLVAVVFSFYAILVTFLILIFGLIRRIGKDGISYTDQLIRALAPAIRYELRLINTDINLYSRGALSPPRLIGVLIISPLFSIGVMVAAWTAATFWMYTTILGEPNQKQGEEVDGKSSARWVKRLWERWLLLAL